MKTIQARIFIEYIDLARAKREAPINEFLI